jgi:FkbM family methyltransferase
MAQAIVARDKGRMNSKAWWLGLRVAIIVGLIESVGLFGAIRLIVAAYTRPRGSRIRVRVRGLRQPVFVRARGSDVFVFVQVFALQEYNFDEFAQRTIVDDAYQAILKTGRKPLIIDCGANVGFASLWFAARFPEVVIIAVEASPESFAVLRENVADYPNIIPLNAAIWDVPGKMRIANPGDAAWIHEVAPVDTTAPRLGPDESGAEIEAVTIPDLLKKHPEGAPFITKIDIEGAESALFRSNTEWMPSMAFIAIEVHDRLQPFKLVGRNFYREIGKHDVEMIFSRENIFAFFRSPDDARRT